MIFVVDYVGLRLFMRRGREKTKGVLVKASAETQETGDKAPPAQYSG